MFKDHPVMLMISGLIISLVISMLFIKTAIPTSFATDSNVVIGGKCYRASGALPEKYSSIKEYVKAEPELSVERLQLAPTNCM